MNEWITICAIDEIPVLGARRVARAQGLDVALFRTASGEVFALLDRCPHCRLRLRCQPFPYPPPPPPAHDAALPGDRHE